MKTNYPLLAKIIAPRNLNEAWLKIMVKKSSGGLDGVSVREFSENLEQNLEQLGCDLVEQRYIPEPLKAIQIPKNKGNNEKRELGLPGVRDKIAQEAVRRVIEPVLEREFLDCSYGYRKGKGPQRAIARVRHYIDYLSASWVVNADIDDFFGSLNHDLLLQRLARVLGDEAVVRLVELWLRMGKVDRRGQWHDVYSGVCQGGVISPLLANFYLHPMDCFLTEKEYGLVRYSDDFVILCPNRKQAEQAYRDTVQFLGDTLALHLNNNIHPILPVDGGFTFLGIHCRPGSLSIAEEKLDRIRSKLSELIRLTPSRTVEETIQKINETVAGWNRYYGRLVEREEFRRIDDMVTSRLGNLMASAREKGIYAKKRDMETALEGLILPGHNGPKARRRLIGKILKLARIARAEQKQNSSGSGPRSAATAVRSKKRKILRKQSLATDLHLTTPGLFLGKTGQRIVVKRNRRIICETLSASLRSVTIAGKGITLSADVVTLCAANNVPLLFTGPAGVVEAMLTSPQSVNAEVQLEQLQAHIDEEKRFQLARKIALGKMKNQRSFAKYLGKYHRRRNNKFKKSLDLFLDSWDGLASELGRINAQGGPSKYLNRIMGLEGRCAALYWTMVQSLLAGRIDFPGRRHQGADDLINSMLNYGYAILQSRVYQAILKSGLHPQVSFLHQPHRRNPTLVYDLMEEFRAQVVDRTVISLLNRNNGLKQDKQGLLTSETRNLFLGKLFERLAAIVQFRGKEMTLDEIILSQARHFTACLMKNHCYRPFVGKW